MKELDAGLAREIDRTVEARRGEAVRLLQELVRVPSVTGEEGAVQEVIERAFQERGLAVDRWEATPEAISPYKDHVGEQTTYEDRPNVVGVRAGRGGVARSCSTRTWTRWRVETPPPGATTRYPARSRETSSTAAARAT